LDPHLLRLRVHGDAAAELGADAAGGEGRPRHVEIEPEGARFQVHDDERVLEAPEVRGERGIGRERLPAAHPHVGRPPRVRGASHEQLPCPSSIIERAVTVCAPPTIDAAESVSIWPFATLSVLPEAATKRSTRARSDGIGPAGAPAATAGSLVAASRAHCATK